MKKKVLFVTKFIPAPAYGGGLKRNFAWIKFLSRYYDVDVIGFWNKEFGNNMINELSPYTKNIYGYTFKRSKLSFLKTVFNSITKKEPIINQQYFLESLRLKIKELCLKYSYEFVFFSEIATTIYRDCINGIPFYFDDHNVEYELIQRTAEFSHFPLKLAYKRDAQLMKRQEILVLKHSKMSFFVSERDKNMFNKAIKNKSYVVNNTYEDCYSTSNIISECPNIVFVGNLSWKPNKQGLLHFINNIYPNVFEKYPNISFHIIGSSINNKIKKYNNVMNIKIYENASEQLKKRIIDEAWICIVPVYFGSGTRIKILEYWSHAKVVVSSKIGAEGLVRSKGTFIEDNDKNMSNRINKLLSNKEIINKLGNYNYNCFKANYDEEKVYGNTLYNTIFTK